tara:strand:- start:2966 stop:3682 length:717 start_codon:yes stop_codon:yes gene_type:complete
MPKNDSLSTLASNIKQGIESRLKELHTSIPGIIETFDAEKQLATIQPAIKRIFITRDGEKEILTPSDLPLLINVPIIFPRGGGFSLTFPVKKGDECLISFCERSIDNWHNTGKIQIPGARRFHSLSDATAFVGLSSLVNKIPNYDDTNTQLKSDDGKVEITLLDDGTISIKAETKVTVDAPDAEFTGNVKILGNLEVIGNTVLSSTVTSNGKDISDTHTHVGSSTAPSGPQVNTGAPV